MQERVIFVGFKNGFSGKDSVFASETMTGLAGKIGVTAATVSRAIDGKGPKTTRGGWTIVEVNLIRNPVRNRFGNEANFKKQSNY